MRARRHLWAAWGAALCWMVGWPLHASMTAAQSLAGYAVVCTENGARLVRTGEQPQAPQAGGSLSCPVCIQLLEASAASGPAYAGPALLLRTAELAKPRRGASASSALPRVSDLARAPPTT